MLICHRISALSSCYFHRFSSTPHAILSESICYHLRLAFPTNYNPSQPPLHFFGIHKYASTTSHSSYPNLLLLGSEPWIYYLSTCIRSFVLCSMLSMLVVVFFGSFFFQIQVHIHIEIKLSFFFYDFTGYFVFLCSLSRHYSIYQCKTCRV